MGGFYKHSGRRDGYLNKCKQCCKDQATARRNTKLEQIREYDRIRSRGSRFNEAKKNWSIRNPIKVKAIQLLGRSLKSGKLTRGICCESQGCTRKEGLHGHHDDYSKPLEVRWLCSPCHRKWHRDNGEGLNGK